MPGQVFIVSAPSGTGKTTLLRELLSWQPRLRFSISYTTRPPRPGEVPGQDYFFVSSEEFRRLKDWGALVEYVEQFGHWYGTSREWVMQTLAAGFDLVFDVDTRGAKALKHSFPHGTYIFILPPDLDTLAARLQKRGDLTPAELTRRLAAGRQELKEAYWYDYLVINDDIHQAVEKLKAIWLASHCHTRTLWPTVSPRYL